MVWSVSWQSVSVLDLLAWELIFILTSWREWTEVDRGQQNFFLGVSCVVVHCYVLTVQCVLPWDWSCPVLLCVLVMLGMVLCMHCFRCGIVYWSYWAWHCILVMLVMVHFSAWCWKWSCWQNMSWQLIGCMSMHHVSWNNVCTCISILIFGYSMINHTDVWEERVGIFSIRIKFEVLNFYLKRWVSGIFSWCNWCLSIQPCLSNKAFRIRCQWRLVEFKFFT